jgi:serine protease Do
MDRTSRALPLVVLLLVLTGSAGADEKSRLPDVLALEETMQEVIKKAEPAIACILVSHSDDPHAKLDDPAVVPESFGSGVVIDAQGLILTNYHVVRDAARIFVRLPGDKSSYAEVHAADPRSDLAVLRLRDTKLAPLKALRPGDGDNVRKGQFVLSLANPYAAGFRDGSPSASWGIISNLRRRQPGNVTEEVRFRTLQQFGILLQTDVRTNLGCSGGALVDLKGELIGLTTSLAAITGTDVPGGFAVPMDSGIKRIIEVLRRGEEVEYGFLGVGFPTSPDVIREAVRQGHGIPLGSVVPGSPAAGRGLRGNDRGVNCDHILKVNGIPVRDPDDMFLILGTLLAGSSAKLEVFHATDGSTETITVTLAKFYVPGKVIVSKKPEAPGGLRVDYTSILYLRPRGEQIYARGIPRGVMIREVVSGSAADTARLQEDKIISRVNGKEVNTPEEFYKEMQNAGGTAELTLVNLEGREERVKIDTK